MGLYFSASRLSSSSTCRTMSMFRLYFNYYRRTTTNFRIHYLIAISRRLVTIRPVCVRNITRTWVHVLCVTNCLASVHDKPIPFPTPTPAPAMFNASNLCARSETVRPNGLACHANVFITSHKKLQNYACIYVQLNCLHQINIAIEANTHKLLAD